MRFRPLLLMMLLMSIGSMQSFGQSCVEVSPMLPDKLNRKDQFGHSLALLGDYGIADAPDNNHDATKAFDPGSAVAMEAAILWAALPAIPPRWACKTR